MEREKDREVKWFTQEQNLELCTQVGYPNQEELLSDKWKWHVGYKHYKRLPKPWCNYCEEVLTREGNSVAVD